MHHQTCTTCEVAAMRTWKITPTHQSILYELSEGKSLRKIASLLGLNHSTVIRHVKQLEQRGYISRQVRSTQVLYSILPAGISNMHHPVRDDLTGGSIHAPPPEANIRLHRLQLKFDLINSIKDPTVISFKDHPSKIVPLEHWSKNIIQFEDFTAILTTRSLIIAGVQRYLKASENIEVQESDIMSEIIPFAEQVEEKIRRIYPSFRLKRLDRGVLSGKILTREYAYEHHPIAEKAKSMRIDAEDGKPRIIVDQSKGFPELETVHNGTAAEDMDMLARNTELLASTNLTDALKALTTQVSIVSELAKHAVSAQDQMDQVISAIANLTRAVGGGA